MTQPIVKCPVKRCKGQMVSKTRAETYMHELGPDGVNGEAETFTGSTEQYWKCIKCGEER